jgi:predicted enzyme related to lactoylglutathione lyase
MHLEHIAIIVDDYDAAIAFFVQALGFELIAYERMRSAGVQFVSEPRDEPYGRVVVFLDIAGNRWDLLGPG